MTIVNKVHKRPERESVKTSPKIKVFDNEKKTIEFHNAQNRASHTL